MISFRHTYANINLDAIDSNIKLLKQHIDKNIIGVIKAYGYGHGDVETAKILIENGINFLAVSSLDEAIHLRENDINCSILVLSHINSEDIATCEKYNISITVGSLEYALTLPQNSISTHIKVDSGMNRIGIRDANEIKDVINHLSNLNYKIEGLFTHYSSADNNDDYYEFQKKNFKQIIEQLNYNFKYVHSGNSASSILKSDIGNYVRLGIAMYGLKPFPTCNLNLKQAMSLTTQIIQIKECPKGTMIGYGHTYETTKNTYIATIPIGYADGLLRCNQNRDVLINEKRYKIVGRICMDQCMIEVDQKYPIGTEVAIFNDILTIDEIARDLNTINYEIVTNVSDRVTRRYYKNNEIIKEINFRK